ncbi:MAG TPA: hypothetical protein VGV38_10925 [Pyrinomonadaceae bacterium]|nr:hypothetical protein [Pyrinomonadaceae bacterium]
MLLQNASSDSFQGEQAAVAVREAGDALPPPFGGQYEGRPAPARLTALNAAGKHPERFSLTAAKSLH